jgi:hypothetical protein
MVLYTNPTPAEAQLNMSPEEVTKGMEPWNAWFKKSGNTIVDIGTPLTNAQRLTKKSSDKCMTEVTGYSILQAENMEAAKAMLSDNPHFKMPEAGIEVLEMISM